MSAAAGSDVRAPLDGAESRVASESMKCQGASKEHQSPPAGSTKYDSTIGQMFLEPLSGLVQKWSCCTHQLAGRGIHQRVCHLWDHHKLPAWQQVDYLLAP